MSHAAVDLRRASALAGLAGVLLAAARDPFPPGTIAAIAILTIAVDRVPVRACVSIGVLFGALDSLAFWSFLVSGAAVFFSAALLHTACGAIFVFALRLLARRGPLGAFLGAPGVWVALEVLRGTGPLHPFPLGDFFGEYTPLIQIADLGGSQAVAFVLVAFGIGIGLAVIDRAPRPLLFGSIGVTISLAYGFIRMGGFEAGRQLRVSVVQHAVPYWVYTLGKADPPIAELVKKTYLSSLGEDADLLVWPETAIPYDPLRTPWVRAKIGEPGRPPLLAGMPRRSADGGEHNTAWYFPANGGRVTHYDKRLLVPVMEGHLGPGAEAAIIGGGDLAVAPGICWESVYPRLSAHAVQADLLGFLSDLGALGASDMPWLHARTAILRAVEQRRPAIYAGQTGPSLVIDAGGRVVGRTAPWERATLRATLAIPPRSATLYEQSRGAFPIAAALAGVFLFARALMRVPDQGRRRRR